jgi:MFS family permease
MEVLPEVVGKPGLLSGLPGTGSLGMGARKGAVRATVAPSLRRVLGLVTVAWMFGSVWQMAVTSEPVTLFAQKLGASNFQFGLLTALPFIASLMSVPGSILVELTGQRKGLFLGAFYVQRAMWIGIGLIPMWMISRFGWGAAGQSLSMFLWMVFVMYAIGAMGSPAWTCWMADVVPARLNGKYFSRRRQWGNLTAIPAAILIGWFFDRISSADDLSTLRWCAILFIGCAVCGLGDIHMFQHVPGVVGKRREKSKLLASFREPLGDRSFLRFSGYIGVLTFGNNLLGQFATLYLLQQAGASNMATQMIVVVAPMLGQLLVLGVLGRAADRMGKRPLLAVASIGLIPMAIGWCFVTPGRLWAGYALSGLGAALWAGVEVANMNLVLEASRGSRSKGGGSSYVAINTVIINLAGCFGGLTAGLMAQALRDWHWQPVGGLKVFTFFDVLFVVSAVIRVGAVVGLLPLIKEAGARSGWQTAGFIATGLGRGIAGWPVRAMRRGMNRGGVLKAQVSVPVVESTGALQVECVRQAA